MIGKKTKCRTLSDMKTATLSIRLDNNLDRLLDKACRQIGRSRSAVARAALRRQLRLTQFDAIRRRMMPFAEARGFLTDEDVFDEMSLRCFSTRTSSQAPRQPGGLCADLFRTVIESHILVISEHLIGEVRRILDDKFRAPPDLIEDLVWLLQQDAIEANAQPLTPLPLSDPADIAIVSSALNGGADVLVTGDKEIIELGRVGEMRIMTPRQFWNLKRDQREPL